MGLGGIIPFWVNIFNVITGNTDNVNVNAVQLDNGLKYFKADRDYRAWPDGTIEVYYPSQDRWAVYGTAPSVQVDYPAYNADDVASIVSGGSGTAPTFKLEMCVQMGIAIAQDNNYGYNWSVKTQAQYQQYQGRCGGWYAYLYNQNASMNAQVRGDFDCSSFIAFLLWKNNIFPGNMENYFRVVTDNLGYFLRTNGFREYTIANTPNLKMQRGDILLRQSGSRSAGTYSGHTALCIGSGEIVHAKSNAFGNPNDRALQAKYQERGDYLGHELVTQPSTLGEWIWLYRWNG